MKKHFKLFIKQKLAARKHWSRFEIILFQLFVSLELEERKHWPRFEIILFDQERELYRDILYARNVIEHQTWRLRMHRSIIVITIVFMSILALR